MSVALSIHGADDFARRFRDKQEEIANDAQTARTGFTERMAELVSMQQQEIIRLNKVIKDNTVIPDRHAATMAVSSTTDQQGRVKHVLVATASDKSMWLMENYSPNGRPQDFRWGRIPLLPQAADEADAGR